MKINTYTRVKAILLGQLFLSVLLSLLLLSACDEDIDTPPDVVTTGELVDLRAQQTSIKSQGSRGTCITFSATAALEAAYKRLGYGDLDLSEEFMNHMGKTFWLHEDWTDIVAKGEDGSETQVGAFGGGNGGDYIYNMWKRGLKIPLEEMRPYQSVEYTPANDPTLVSTNFLDEAFKKQRAMSDFNLDPGKLSHDLLHSDKFYGVSLAEFYDVASGKARDTDFLERILRSGFEVVWDFSGTTTFGPLWRPCGFVETGCTELAHSMLLVGFDKTGDNEEDHHFIVKNSWGATHTGTDDDFTLISYDFVREFGSTAAYIKVPILDPETYDDLKFIGRWNLVFDGHDGELDIYHIPGYWFERPIEDKRLGTFYSPDGKAHKVNGKIEGNKITFYFDGGEPDLRWDNLQGRKFQYYLSDEDYMAGFHADPGGGTYAGYAKKGELFPDGTLTSRPFSPVSYENTTWQLYFDDRSGVVRLDKIVLPEGIEFPSVYEIFGTFTDEDGEESEFILGVPQTAFNQFFIDFSIDGEAISMEGRHLNHTAGNISGHSTGSESIRPFVMVRL